MFPFWAVPRMSMPELKIAALKSTHPQLRFNLEYVQKEVMVVVVGNAAGASMPITYGVTVPVLTNAVAVKQGDDLLLEIIVTKKLTKRKDIGWKDHAKRVKSIDNKPPKAATKTEV